MNFIKPKVCDICHDPIALYRPWYSVKVSGKLAIPNLKANPMSLCPDCFHAYEDFLVKQEVEANHKKNLENMRGGQS